MRNHIIAALQEAQSGLAQLITNEAQLSQIGRAATVMVECFRAGAKVISCGNGGSHCDAMHFAEELSGRFRDNRKPIAALAISDPAHLTCTGNDFGFVEVFSRFVAAHGRKGDVLLAISTSGKSANVIRATKEAHARGMQVVALTGQPGSELGGIVDIDICTPAGRYADRVQELHIKVIHIIIELIERQLYPENY